MSRITALVTVALLAATSASAQDAQNAQGGGKAVTAAPPPVTTSTLPPAPAPAGPKAADAGTAGSSGTAEAGAREAGQVGAWRILCGADAGAGCVARQSLASDDGEGWALDLILSAPSAEGEPAVMTVTSNIMVAVAPGFSISESPETALTPFWHANLQVCGTVCMGGNLIDTGRLSAAKAPAVVMTRPDGSLTGVGFSTERMGEVLEKIRVASAPAAPESAAPAAPAASEPAPAASEPAPAAGQPAAAPADPAE